MYKVLIAEDNALNMRLFKDLLEMKKAEVICVDKGRNVMRSVKKYHPDLVLMDIHLDNISGIDLIKALKANKETKNIPIIALTAFVMKNDKEEIMNSGCEGYMSKPIAIDSFLGLVEKFIPV